MSFLFSLEAVTQLRLQHGPDEYDQGEWFGMNQWLSVCLQAALWELTDPFPAALWTGFDDQLDNGHILKTSRHCSPLPIPQSAVIRHTQQEELVCSFSDAKHRCHLCVMLNRVQASPRNWRVAKKQPPLIRASLFAGTDVFSVPDEENKTFSDSVRPTRLQEPTDVCSASDST